MKSHVPAIIRSVPAMGAIRRPKDDVIFSTRINNARRTTQSKFITPPTNNSAISTQQQPTQYAPWRRPRITEPVHRAESHHDASGKQKGVWHSARQMSFARSPLIATRHQEHERSQEFARGCHCRMVRLDSYEYLISPTGSFNVT